ncbi:DNA topoisomerase III [Listeria monocytogenes]|nr:type IA DNA topoisomerase [Listeria monocytogenes]EAG9407333.1 type IA DNA topoisomerase [Listeria monocytogenes]EEP2907163.1 DNA topoisomerase III [Listeria monocytogenes]EEP2907603.1 DNA topoisomerase III [Listeria monocytogenes]EEP6699441.1 DNA topoisomerase III [Listeria monocytogenes]
MNLVIAEKPSVAQSIAKVLGAASRKDGYTEGNGYIISWCVGHLVELATADSYNEKYAKWRYEDLPILPAHWQYNVSSITKKQFDVLKKLMADNQVETVICATDAGREGELIFRLVYDKAKCKKTIKRLWISSLEDSAIQNGFKNLKDGKEYENLYQAALCRAKADWIVGINATRLFSVLYGQTLNIGRVMSPTLAMICERDANISVFQPEPFYTVHLTCNGFSMIGEKLKDKAQATKLLKACDGQSVTVESVEQKEKTEKPPKLYDLTTLQREANKLLGFTAEQTLQYAQSLYEKKYITYPRTDSRFLTEDMNGSIPVLATAMADFFMPKEKMAINTAQVIDNFKVTDHHAIIPTMNIKGLDVQSLPHGERETLLLLAIRLLVAIGDAHCFSETVITAKCGDSVFTAKGKTVTQEGFKAVQKLYKGEQPKEEKDQALPSIVQGDVFTTKAEIKEGKTSPPKPFTDDTLLSSMENANRAETDAERKGIGTPATRAGILEKLIKTGLAERKGDKKVKYFTATHKGTALIKVLPEQVQSPLMTAEWEEKLKLVERGELSADAFLSEIVDMTSALVKTYEMIKGADTLFPSNRESVGKCPRCGGAVSENKKGFCCSDKSCGFAIWKENRFFTAKKKTVTKAIITELLKSGKAPLKGCYSEKTGKTYDCIAVLDDTGGQFVNFTMEFIPRKK